MYGGLKTNMSDFFIVYGYRWGAVLASNKLKKEFIEKVNQNISSNWILSKKIKIRVGRYPSVWRDVL